jgi:hypothetical protein
MMGGDEGMGGEAACLLPQVCAECGKVREGPGSHRCEDETEREAERPQQ